MTRHSISVFFPCYNEQDNVESLVRQAWSVLNDIVDDFEIIIVNDGSSDNTKEIADKLVRDLSNVKAVHHTQNTGYGGALQSGFKNATKELVFYTDGDKQFDIGELKDIIHLIDKCDIVSCYRISRQDRILRKLNAWAWNKLVCFLFKLKIKDIDCAFKLYKRKIFDDIIILSSGALVDTEILARAVAKGYTIKQVGVRHFPRTAGKSTGANPLVILKAFKELLKLRNNIISSGKN